jgi:hypothetical protein
VFDQEPLARILSFESRLDLAAGLLCRTRSRTSVCNKRQRFHSGDGISCWLFALVALGLQRPKKPLSNLSLPFEPARSHGSPILDTLGLEPHGIHVSQRTRSSSRSGRVGKWIAGSTLDFDGLTRMISCALCQQRLVRGTADPSEKTETPRKCI